MTTDLKLVRRGLRDRVVRARRVVARATAWPFAVRLFVYGSALVAELFAYPFSFFLGETLFVLALAAALPALWPRTAVVTSFWLCTAVGWLAATTLYPGQATLVRLAGVAVCLYGVHSGAALAAVLPYDAVVHPSAVVRWLLRTAIVAVVSVALSMGAMFYISGLPVRSYLVASLVGLALAAGVAWLIARSGARGEP
jgi:hypothetical protein